jgi:hypothetical protein
MVSFMDIVCTHNSDLLVELRGRGEGAPKDVDYLSLHTEKQIISLTV